jgi:haloacetate dehalogenase
VWTHTSKQWATKSWHWLFMIQPYDMPERMMAGVPAAYYMEKKLSKPGIGLGFLHPDAFAEYVRCFTWKTIRGSCEDYRACASCDFEMDEADYKAEHKIACPLLVTWGARSHTGTVHGDVLAVWRNYATNATGGPIDCGHYVPEEAPDAVFDAFMRHFKT